ncbi:MAG: phytase [Pseudomonadota bacterium]
MLRLFHGFALVSLGIAAACASIPAPEERGGDPAVSVTARAETKPVGTANADAADDPAIWRDPVNPAKSLIVGTDKRAGLYVYDLAGKELSFLEAPGLNNVDLVTIEKVFPVVLASDRADLETAHITVALLNPINAEMGVIERIEVGPGEGYGICAGPVAQDRSFSVFSAPKNGIIYETRLSEGEKGALEHVTKTLTTVPSQPEGCVVDPRTGTLYIGEEAAGIWAIDIETGDKSLIARTGTGMLVPDVEGLALAPEGETGGYLVASSQGDNAFAVYRLPDYAPLGRFRIAKGEFGSVEETDGIELDPGALGPDFPGGVFIAQDGINEAGAQNFKLVRWDEILAALELSAEP